MKICVKKDLYVDLDCEKEDGYLYVAEVKEDGEKILVEGSQFKVEYLKKVVRYGA